MQTGQGMLFNDYQKLAMRTRVKGQTNSDSMNNFTYGAVGEIGECVDVLKKHLFQGHPLNVEKLKEEVGDVLWYIALLCEAAGLNMEDVAEHNIKKLMARYPKGFSAEDSIGRKD